MIPILRNHNHLERIGTVTPDGDRLVVEIASDAEVTFDAALAAFGSLRVLESEWRDGRHLLRKAIVFEFSIDEDES